MKCLLIASSLILATTAFAGQPATEVQPLAPNLAHMILKLVDAHGEIQAGDRVHVRRMEWVWSKATPTDLLTSPALRVWLETRFPEDWQIDKVTGTSVTLAEPFKPGKAETWAEPFREGGTQSLAIDLRSRTASLRMAFRDKRDRASEITLAVQLNIARPYILIRPECTAQHVHVLVNKAEARHLFVGLSCIDTGDGVDVYFFRSNESKWDNESPGLVRFDPEAKYASFKQHFGKPTHDITVARGLFQVGTVDDQGRKTDYSVFFKTNKAALKRLTLRVGLRLARYQLNEKSHDVALTQYTLNALIGADYQLIPDTLLAKLDFNGDLFAFEHGPRDVPQAHFYGLEGLFGYRLPLNLSFVDFTVYGGWYLWGMRVSTDRYGIGPLAGPMGSLTLGHFPEANPGWLIWLKYATLGDHGQLLSTFDHELGIGALLELGGHAQQPLALTAEFKNAHAVSQPNQIELKTITLGIRKEF